MPTQALRFVTNALRTHRRRSGTRWRVLLSGQARPSVPVNDIRAAVGFQREADCRAVFLGSVGKAVIAVSAIS